MDDLPKPMALWRHDIFFLPMTERKKIFDNIKREYSTETSVLDTVFANSNRQKF